MGKSQRNKKNSFVQKLLNAVVVVLVVATVLVMLWGVLNSQGVPHKLFNAVKVGDVGISVLEYNYYYETALQNFYNQYYSIIGYLGIDFNKSFKKQDSGWGEEGGTWDDYFKELTNGYVSEAVVLSEAAKAKGMTLNEENKAEIEKTLEENRKAAQSNQISLKQFYAMYYGSGMNEKVLRNLMERQYLAAQYVDELLESYQYSDQQIKDYYTEHADDMDYFNYMKYSFSIAAPQGNTDEEKKAWVDAVKAKAQEMCDKVTDRASFAALAVEYTEDETKKEDYEDEDACYKHLLKSSVGVNEEEWVVSADRKNGDKTVVSGESTVDGKELVVTTGLGFYTDGKWVELAQKLLENHASGLIINTGGYLYEVPKCLKEFCDENDLPLLTVPWEVVLVDMIKDLSIRLFLQGTADEQIIAAFIRAIEKPQNHERYRKELLQHFDVDGIFRVVLITTDGLDEMDTVERKKLSYRLQIYLENITHNGSFFYYDGNFVLVMNDVSQKDFDEIVNGMVRRTKRRMPEVPIYVGSGPNVAWILCRRIFLL